LVAEEITEQIIKIFSHLNGELARTSMAKSLLLTYLCWLTGGLFGLHHFYLGRDDHAFITLATFGGYFTLGLIRDLWRLPEYVKEANNDPEYLDKLHQQIKINKRPSSSIVRQSGMMIMGNLLAFLVEYAIPIELLPDSSVIILKSILVPFASAFGVWLTGNVGRHQGSLDKPLMAAYLAASLSHIFNLRQYGSFSTLAAFIVFSRYCREWRVKPAKKKSVLLRIFIFALCVAIYVSLWSSWLYFNCTIQDPETEKPIKCRVALDNFMKSSAYTNLSEAVWILVEHARHQGFSGLWREMMQEFDLSGRSAALATLGLQESATQKEILAQYKKLSREYHPDRERDESKKQEKHEKFIQVQEAYRKLRMHEV
jgi:DnaJ family protein C protein 22